MRTTQMLLLALALLIMLASGTRLFLQCISSKSHATNHVVTIPVLHGDFAGAVTEASMDGSAKFRYRCEDTLIPSPKPCDDDTCNVACYNLMRVPKQGKCDAVGCKCMICERQPPMSSN
ncbi:hypothetical protein ACQJBY_056393 [Aegilops geniculata]